MRAAHVFGAVDSPGPNDVAPVDIKIGQRALENDLCAPRQGWRTYAVDVPIRKSKLMLKMTSLRNVSAFVLMPGAIVNILAYRSAAPMLVVCIWLFIITILLTILDRRGHQERTAVFLVFAVCWFWAGISAVYVEYLDPNAQGPDATFFYNVVTTGETAFADGAAVIQYAG